ncbi:hypothetical protein [Engelhardtia mirabilis]|uniref:hypothetical protein n=1 Tax=Engelhardtia mirabilis TaxID=2528011 RepID=UPI0011A37A13
MAADLELAELVDADLLARIVELGEGREFEHALQLVEAFDRSGRADDLPEPELAALNYAQGLLLVESEPLAVLEAPYDPPEGAAAERVERARAAFAKARAYAGGGILRQRAVYAAGTLELWLAERELRRFVVANGPDAPTPPLPVPGQEPEEPPDPKQQIEELIGRFEGARDLLAERVRSDWSDADPRANLEWSQRRIRELERALQQMEEQEQQQQEQQQDGDQQQEGDPQQDQDQQPSDSDQQQPPDEQKPQDGEESDQEGEQQEEQQVDDAERQDDMDAEQPLPEEGEEEGEQPEGVASEAAQQESLSAEEMTELLDRLAEIERNGEDIRRQLRGIRHVPVERDW